MIKLTIYLKEINVLIHLSSTVIYALQISYHISITFFIRLFETYFRIYPYISIFCLDGEHLFIGFYVCERKVFISEPFPMVFPYSSVEIFETDPVAFKSE